MVFGPRRCYVCNSNTVDKKDLAKHMQDHAKDLDKFKFSNSTSDYCRTTCKICGKVSLISNMRTHTKEKHSMVITEYKKKYNQEFYDIVEKVFHRCGICKLPLLLDSDVVAAHLNGNKTTHNLTHKEYNMKFMVLKNQMKNQNSQTTNQKLGDAHSIQRSLKHLDLKSFDLKVIRDTQDNHNNDNGILGDHHLSKPAGVSLTVEKVPDTETTDNMECDEVVDKISEEDNVLVSEDIDSTPDPIRHSSNQKIKNENEEMTLTVQTFRSFIASITEPGLDPTSFPAIERILAMVSTENI